MRVMPTPLMGKSWYLNSRVQIDKNPKGEGPKCEATRGELAH